MVRSCLESLAWQMAGTPRDEQASGEAGVDSCQPDGTTTAVAPSALQQQVDALEAELKETRRHREEAEMRCQALEQLLAKEPLAKPTGAVQATGVPSKGETVNKSVPSMLERFSFKARVFNVPDQK